jgi:hypothetical protein
MADAQTRQIRIDLLAPQDLMPIAQKPPGVKVSGLRSDAFNGAPPPLDRVPWHVIVEIAKDVTLGVASNWLYDYIQQYRAKRIAIKGREPKDKADFGRIVAEEIEIGKND